MDLPKGNAPISRPCRGSESTCNAVLDQRCDVIAVADEWAYESSGVLGHRGGTYGTTLLPCVNEHCLIFEVDP